MQAGEMTATIGIMRPSRYAAESRKLAETLGFNVVLCPMLETREHRDECFDDFLERMQKGATDYVIFTSANGVEYTLKKIPVRREFIEQLNNSCQVAAIGPGTRRALEEEGIQVAITPRCYSSEGLIEELRDVVAGRHVDILRSTHGAPVLVEELTRHGALVHEACVYTITRPQNTCQREFMRCLQARHVDALAFTSAMMVHNFMSTARELGALEEVRRLLNTEIITGAIGAPTASTLQEYRIHRVLMPEKYLFKHLLLSLKEAIEKQ